MRYITAALMALAATGCANLGSIQADCEKTTKTFPELYRCIDSAIALETRYANSAQVQLFRLKAAQLSGRVERKQIEDIDARVELKQLYVQIRKDQMAETARILAVDDLIPGSKSIKTNCTTYGNTTNCTSK